MRTISTIKRILVDESVADGILAKNIQKRILPGMTYEVTNNAKAVLTEFQRKGNLDDKDTLLVYKYPGKFMSSCPGSDGMVCCQYFVANFGMGCLFDCHYCYLQNYLNNPLLSMFGNLDDFFVEIQHKTRNKKFPFRIGTGEYTDSLVLDPLTGLSKILVEHFAELENATLELKTKSRNVDGLLGLDHRGKTVVSWSINPPEIVNAVEEGSASLDERLDAARKASDAGYKLAFHLDPMIHFPGWEAAYHALIERVADTVNVDKIAWISVGSFRYTQGLKQKMQLRFPGDELTKGEMIQGSDGKHRYFKEIRQDMYRSIKQKIQQVDERLFMYLCMETRWMWDNVFGFIPSSAKNLDQMFESRRQEIERIDGLQPR